MQKRIYYLLFTLYFVINATEDHYFKTFQEEQELSCALYEKQENPPAIVIKRKNITYRVKCDLCYFVLPSVSEYINHTKGSCPQFFGNWHIEEIKTPCQENPDRESLHSQK